MALRRKPREENAPGMAWMLTFADMVTLLLSFFVLLLSMSSMDRSILHDAVSNFIGDVGLAPKKGAGRMQTRFEIIQELIETPAEVLHNPQRFKDLLFPDESLPEGMARSTLEQNLQVLVRPEGVALVLSDGLLFPSGGSELDDVGRKLLAEFGRFLASTTMPVNVAGYTDNVPGTQKDNYSLSMERAMAVLSVFLNAGFPPGRFSVSAYGEAFPLGDNGTPEGRAQNRRVEILLKTSGRTYL